MPHVCPYWVGYFLVGRWRLLFQNPEKILGAYCKPGMTVLDVGSGMGYFTIPVARMVGENGRVIAVDIQEKMLARLRKRAQRAGVADRIDTILCEPDRLEVPKPVDLCIAFNTLHEAPDQLNMLTQIMAALKPSGQFFLSEPRHHVSATDFKETVETALSVGFKRRGEPTIRWSHSMLFEV